MGRDSDHTHSTRAELRFAGPQPARGSHFRRNKLQSACWLRFRLRLCSQPTEASPDRLAPPSSRCAGERNEQPPEWLIAASALRIEPAPQSWLEVGRGKRTSRGATYLETCLASAGCVCFPRRSIDRPASSNATWCRDWGQHLSSSSCRGPQATATRLQARRRAASTRFAPPFGPVSSLPLPPADEPTESDGCTWLRSARCCPTDCSPANPDC